MKTLADVNSVTIATLLKRVDLNFEIVDVNAKIPGSFWGEPEAGLIQNTLYASHKTPIHSILHEAGHYICMTEKRRTNLHTNAIGNSKGEFVEENAVCFLQILLADEINGFSRDIIFNDMDEWGYSFRLGSTKKWFEQDSQDAIEFLRHNRLIDKNNRYLFSLRQ